MDDSGGGGGVCDMQQIAVSVPIFIWEKSIGTKNKQSPGHFFKWNNIVLR